MTGQGPVTAAPFPPRVTVRELMSPKVTTVGAATPVPELQRLMRQHRIRHLPVVDVDGALIGLVSHRDLLLRTEPRSAESDPPLVAALVMSSPVEVVDPETEVRRAAEIMLEGRFGCLPVLEGGILIGILTESDFVRLLSRRGG